MSRRIAIVEDEPAIRANYADALRRHGYDVATYANRADALAAFRTRLPEPALIDIGLGDDIDGGFTLCRELRALSATLPIIFLSARDSRFRHRRRACAWAPTTTSPRTRACRISPRASRRCSAAAISSPRRRPTDDVLERGPLTLDVKRFTARLERPARRPHADRVLDGARARALSRPRQGPRALMRDANIVVDDSTITSHVKRIRRKFQAVDAAFDRIATVYGMGYRWNAE